eukprot:10359164-Alexandrium_andersonii.AAC.1
MRNIPLVPVAPEAPSGGDVRPHKSTHKHPRAQALKQTDERAVACAQLAGTNMQAHAPALGRT